MKMISDGSKGGYVAVILHKLTCGDRDLLISYKQADPPENKSLTVHFLRVCVVFLVPLPATCVVILVLLHVPVC